MACAASLLVAVPMASFESTITRVTLPLMHCAVMTVPLRLYSSTLLLCLFMAPLFLLIGRFGVEGSTAVSGYGIL